MFIFSHQNITYFVFICLGNFIYYFIYFVLLLCLFMYILIMYLKKTPKTPNYLSISDDIFNVSYILVIQ